MGRNPFSPQLSYLPVNVNRLNKIIEISKVSYILAQHFY